jgi:hypothetical protein
MQWYFLFRFLLGARLIVAFMSFVCIAVYTVSSVRIHGIRSLTFLYDHFLGLSFAAFVWSVVLATVTHITSFQGEKTPLLAEGGNTGNHLYDVRSYFPMTLTKSGLLEEC